MCRVPQFLKAPLDAHLRLTAGLAGRRRIPQGPLRVAPLAGPNFCASAASAPLPSVLRRGREPGPSATSAGLRRTRRSGVCIPREASGGRVRQRQPPSQKVEPAQTHPRTSGRAKRSPAERRALTARGTRPRRRPRPPRAARGRPHSGKGGLRRSPLVSPASSSPPAAPLFPAAHAVRGPSPGHVPQVEGVSLASGRPRPRLTWAASSQSCFSTNRGTPQPGVRVSSRNGEQPLQAFS